MSVFGGGGGVKANLDLFFQCDKGYKPFFVLPEEEVVYLELVCSLELVCIFLPVPVNEGLGYGGFTQILVQGVWLPRPCTTM